MTESKHTPGPWTIERGHDGGFSIRNADGWVLATRAPWPDHKEESEANARLIAAAPELLAALQAFMPELDQRERFISANDSAWSASELQMLDRIRKARAAIAKAERTS